MKLFDIIRKRKSQNETEKSSEIVTLKRKIKTLEKSLTALYYSEGLMMIACCCDAPMVHVDFNYRMYDFEEQKNQLEKQISAFTNELILLTEVKNQSKHTIN